MRVLKQTTSISVLTRATATIHAKTYQIVPLVMIRVKVGMVHADLCKILSFMTDHVKVVKILVSVWNIPPSEKDRATQAATAAAAVVNRWLIM